MYFCSGGASQIPMMKFVTTD